VRGRTHHATCARRLLRRSGDATRRVKDAFGGDARRSPRIDRKDHVARGGPQRDDNARTLGDRDQGSAGTERPGRAALSIAIPPAISIAVSTCRGVIVSHGREQRRESAARGDHEHDHQGSTQAAQPTAHQALIAEAESGGRRGHTRSADGEEHGERGKQTSGAPIGKASGVRAGLQDLDTSGRLATIGLPWKGTAAAKPLRRGAAAAPSRQCSNERD
jgi:hypothetical protein